jgi:hypothetical protein
MGPGWQRDSTATRMHGRASSLLRDFDCGRCKGRNGGRCQLTVLGTTAYTANLNQRALSITKSVGSLPCPSYSLKLPARSCSSTYSQHFPFAFSRLYRRRLQQDRLVLRRSSNALDYTLFLISLPNHRAHEAYHHLIHHAFRHRHLLPPLPPRSVLCPGHDHRLGHRDRPRHQHDGCLDRSRDRCRTRSNLLVRTHCRKRYRSRCLRRRRWLGHRCRRLRIGHKDWQRARGHLH